MVAEPNEDTDKEGLLEGLSLHTHTYPCVEIVSGPGEGLRIPIREGENGIGRAGSNTVKLRDSSVSRRHAVIEKNGDLIQLKDLNSRNGTSIRGASIVAMQAVPLGHLDTVRVGIYLLRFLTQAPREEDVDASELRDMAEPAPTEQVRAAEPEDGVSQETGQIPNPFDKPLSTTERSTTERSATPMPVGHLHAEDPSADDHRQKLTASALIVLVLGLGLSVWWAYRMQSSDHEPEEVSLPATPPQQPAPPSLLTGAPAAMDEVKSTTANEAEAPPSVAAVFVTIESTPLPAEIFIGERSFGTTPLSHNIDFEIGKATAVKARYLLPEINETFEVVQSVQVTPGQDTLALGFAATLGTLKFVQLPREVKVYLEAEYAHDPLRNRSIRLEELVYNKPIVVPYGSYVLELRAVPVEKRETSAQEEIVYRRTFVLDAAHSLHEIVLSDQSLAIFPADIESTPSPAEIFYDDKKIGQTPWQGELALGKHRLVVKKQGFEEFAMAIESWRNEPQEIVATLKTSAAGALIFEAKEAYHSRAYERSIELLGKALAEESATETEKSESYYYLGQAYRSINSCDKAMQYFTRVGKGAFRYEAKLGLAECYSRGGENNSALLALAEVLLSGNKKSLLAEAEALFHKLTPIRSVIYLNSTPKQATVFVNGKEMPDRTPVILTDLSIGSYHILTRAEGYADEESTLQLKMSEFRPLQVQLKPIK